MLFSKFFAVSALTGLAAATAIESRSGGIPNEQCPGLQCCELTGQAASNYIITLITTLCPTCLPILLTLPSYENVGVNCSPITGIGGDNGACSQGTIVLCNDNSHAPWLSIGCFPVTI